MFNKQYRFHNKNKTKEYLGKIQDMTLKFDGTVSESGRPQAVSGYMKLRAEDGTTDGLIETCEIAQSILNDYNKE